MKKQTKKLPSFKRKPALIIVLILLMAVVALITAKILASVSQNNVNNEPESAIESPTETTTDIASDNIENPNKTPAQYEGPDPNELDYLTGVITYAGLADDNLSVRTNIDQFLDTGTCELTLTQETKTVTRTVDIIANPSSSTCDGFEVPISELSSGTWQINIKLTSGDKNGTITGEANL